MCKEISPLHYLVDKDSRVCLKCIQRSVWHWKYWIGRSFYYCEFHGRLISECLKEVSNDA